MSGLSLFACGGGVALPDGTAWPAAPVPGWSSQQRLGLTNSGDDTVAFVSMDLPNPQLLGRMPVGNVPVALEGPHHLQGDPSGEFLYVGLSNFVPGSGSGPHGSHGVGTVPGSLLKLRARDLVRAGEAVVDRNPGDLILSGDGKTAYLTHYDVARLQDQIVKGLPEDQGYSTVAVIDTATMARPPLIPVCPTGHGMTLSRDEKTLYVTCAQTDQLAILDLATKKVTRVYVGAAPGKPLSPAYAPYAVVRAPADDSLWISCNASGDLRVYDTKAGRMDETRRVFVNGVPMFGHFLSDGKTLILPHQGDDKLSIVDTSAAKETATITLPGEICTNAHVATVTPDDKTAYVVCEGDHVTKPGTLIAVSLEAKTVIGYVATGIYPDAVVQLPPAK